MSSCSWNKASITHIRFRDLHLSYHSSIIISINMTDLANRRYLRWDTEGVEKVPPNEKEDIHATAKMLNDIQKAMYNQHRHCFGGLRVHRHSGKMS